MADQSFRPEVGSSMEKLPVDPDVVSRFLINGPNRNTGPVIFSAEDMANTGDHLEVYLADDPNPLEIHFPTEDFVEFRRDVVEKGVHTKGRAQIDLLEDMYPQGAGVSLVGERFVSLSLGRGRDNFEGFGTFESPKVSRKHCLISFDLINRTLVIGNYEERTNQTKIVRKHQEISIDDFATTEPETLTHGAKSGILRKHFDGFMRKFEQVPHLFNDFGAASIEASYRNNALENEDRLVIDKKAGVFAVFDGMGGGNGGALAADIAAEVTKNQFKGLRGGNIMNPQEALEDLTRLMQTINTAILKDPDSEESGTTAMIVRLISSEDGDKALAWVSVGDSRLYLSKGSISQPEQITTDETIDIPKRRKGSVLTNCLGWQEGSFKGVRHAGILDVSAGDRIILCTDGITGDEGEELMLEPEIEKLTRGLDTAKAAESLVENARKNDDRTAIVVDV